MTKNYSRCLHIKNICNNILFRFILLFSRHPQPTPSVAQFAPSVFREFMVFGARGALCAFVLCIILHYPMTVRSLTVARNIGIFTFIFNTKKWKGHKTTTTRQMGKVKAKSINWRQRKMKNLFELLNQRIAVLRNGNDNPDLAIVEGSSTAIYFPCKLLVRKCGTGNAMNKIKAKQMVKRRAR